MNITKAVIPVAGWSTRFLPAVKSYAKHLVPLLDKPQLQIIMEELLAAGITEFAIVHRPDEQTIKNFFEPQSELDAYLKTVGKEKCLESYHLMLSGIKRIEFLPQTPNFPYGNGVPLLVAKDFIGQDPFVYLWGDDITIEDVPGHFLSKMISTFQQYQPDGVLAVQKVTPEEITRLGSMSYAKNPKYPNQIDGEIEKPEADKAPSLYGQGGRFVITPRFIEVLESQPTSKGELWFTEAVNTIAKDGVILTENYQESGAFWATTGDPLNWLKANITLALKDPRYSDHIKTLLSTHS
jgi:UTP--glucose-1-phosphate uridylyltransferase